MDPIKNITFGENLTISGKVIDENNMPIRTFKSMNQAAEWLVHNNFAKSLNSAKVSITHSINGRQHYWGKDFICKSAYGLIWKSIR